MKKKIIALLMAVVSCFSLGATASAAENPEQTFKDVEPGTWYYEGVEYVNDLGLMTGMGRVFCGIVQTVNLQIRMTDSIASLHKVHPEKSSVFIKWNFQMPADIPWIHILIFRKIMTIRLHFQIMFFILFL